MGTGIAKNKHFNSSDVFRRGSPAGPKARRRAAAKHDAPEIEIRVKLGAGRAAARVWTCDLSYDYVRINAEYTT